MYKLAIIFLFLAFSNAIVVKKQNVTYTHVDSRENSTKNQEKVCLANAPKDTLWVLDVMDDDLNFSKMRSANKMDNRVFKEVMEPAIKYFKHQEILKANDKKHSKPNVAKTSENESDFEDITTYDVKKLLYKIVNKFILSYQGEPNLHLQLASDHNKISIKLYFKGPYTSLIIRYKNKRYHYFINPPSSLPHWFYEKPAKVTHSGQTMYATVPEAVRKEFYVKFYYLLKSLLSFAI